MEMLDFKDIISKVAFGPRRKHSFPWEEKGCQEKRTTPKEHLPRGQLGLFTAPSGDATRRAGYVFYATAHLELSEKSSKEWSLKKTGKDYSLWQNQGSAMEARDHVGRRRVATGHRGRENEARARGKKKTGTYYVKKPSDWLQKSSTLNWR